MCRSRFAATGEHDRDTVALRRDSAMVTAGCAASSRLTIAVRPEPRSNPTPTGALFISITKVVDARDRPVHDGDG